MLMNMLDKFIKIVLLTMLYSLTACVAPQKTWEGVTPIFMVEAARNRINSTRVVVGLNPESTMAPKIATANSGQQFGLIGALIESAIVHGENDAMQDRQRLVNNIRSEALKYNFGSKFREEIENNLQGLDWLKVTFVVKEPSLQTQNVSNILKSINEDVLLVMDCKYSMSEDFSKIFVMSHVAMHPRNEELSKIALQFRPNEDLPTLYRHLFKYEYPFDGVFSDVIQAANGWSANNGEMIHKALDAAIADLATQIIADLSAYTVEQRISLLD